MKILCVADHIDPLVYSTSIKSRFTGVELILGAGDLPLNYYDFIMSTLNKPLLFVFGNHNLRHIHLYKRHRDAARGVRPSVPLTGTYLPTGAKYIGNRLHKEKFLLVAGLGGSIWYNGGQNQFREHQVALRIAKMIPRMIYNKLCFGRYLDILLTHAPPAGIHDMDDPCHRGFKVFLWFMRTFKPKYLVHGHTHLYSGEAVRRTRYRDTIVVNAYDHVVIEAETK